MLSLDKDNGAPLLNIFGGKITTYRYLAEEALEKLSGAISLPQNTWTAGVPLAGGAFAINELGKLELALNDQYEFLTPAWTQRLVRTYGTEARVVLGAAKTTADLGQDFGATLSEAEVRWLMAKEFAQTADDIVWRRTKLGLKMNKAQILGLETWMKDISP